MLEQAHLDGFGELLNAHQTHAYYVIHVVLGEGVEKSVEGGDRQASDVSLSHGA